MPPVLAELALVVFNFVWATGATIEFAIGVTSAVTALTIGGTVAGAVYGVSALSRKLQGPDRPPATPQDMQQVVRQAIPDRFRHYGLVKVGGPVLYEQARDGTLWAIIARMSGEIAGTLQVYLDDVAATIDGGGNVLDSQFQFGGSSMVRVVPYNGSDSQAASDFLLQQFPEEWTADHRLRGIAYSLLAITQVPADSFSAVFPNGAPQCRVVLQSSKVYDPRDGAQSPTNPATWTWTSNAALIILDHATHADGMNRPRSMFNTAAFIQAANDCDDAIALKGGGTAARYRIDGSYSLSEPPEQVQRDMLAACDGEFYYCNDGTIGLRVGKWVAPTVTIADADIISYSDMRRGANALAAYNVLKLFYQSPDLDYQEVECDAWDNTVLVLSTGDEKVEELHLRYVLGGRPTQARRLGKIASYKDNPAWLGTVVCNANGLRAYGERFITLQIAELGINTTFRLLRMRVAADFTRCEMDVIAFPSAAYDWDANAEEGATPAARSAASADPSAPASVVWFNGTSGVSALLSATWSAVAGNVGFQIQYEPLIERTPPGAETYGATSTIGVVYGSASWVSAPLAEGEYRLRIRATNVYGVSAWSGYTTKVAPSTSTLPAQASAVTVSDGGGAVLFQFTQPGSASFYKTELKIDGGLVATWTGAKGLARTFSVAKTPGSYAWSIQTFNVNGNAQTALTGSVIVA